MRCLRMAAPLAGPRTGMLYRNVKVPADLQNVALGRRVGLSVGDDMQEVAIGGKHVKVGCPTTAVG